MEESNVQAVAEEAIAKEGKQELSLREYKNLLRQFFTVRHPRVVACGHKIDPHRQPNNNCEYCWFAFFNSHGELVQTADAMFTNAGREALVKLQGTKFVKNFLKFMSTLAAWKAKMEATAAKEAELNQQMKTTEAKAEELNGQVDSTGSTGSSSGTDSAGSASESDSGSANGESTVIHGGEVEGARDSREAA